MPHAQQVSYLFSIEHAAFGITRCFIEGHLSTSDFTFFYFYKQLVFSALDFVSLHGMYNCPFSSIIQLWQCVLQLHLRDACLLYHICMSLKNEILMQGLVAGINAARFASQKSLIVLERESSYIGTLIDDLVTKDLREPYRMLTR
jgi:hypothetical protein